MQENPKDWLKYFCLQLDMKLLLLLKVWSNSISSLCEGERSNTDLNPLLPGQRKIKDETFILA